MTFPIYKIFENYRYSWSLTFPIYETISIFIFDIFSGPLPSMLVFGFMDSDRFDGTYSKSVLKFERQNLESAEIQFDSQPIIGHPLIMNGSSSSDFFISYLKNTNRFLNPLVTGSLSNEDFEKWNFLIFTNLKTDEYKHGQLTLKLNFSAVLPNNLLCLFIPIWERKVNFDSYFNASVTN